MLPALARPAPPFAGVVLVLSLGLASLGGQAQAQEAIREEVKRAEPKLTRPPTLLKFIPAPYPAEARRRGVRGAVELQLEVSATGTVSRVEVLGTPDRALARAASEAARQFRFSPAEVDNKPAPVRLRYIYNFVLETAFRPRLPRWMEEGKLVAEGSDAMVGQVREEGTRLPLAGVAVALPALGQETRTDDRGVFRFAEIPPGRYQVKAISLQHRPETVTAAVKAGEQTRIQFYLPPLADNPYETVVRGQRRQTVVSRVSLRQKELTTVPGTFGDPIRVIESLPGVARVPYVGGALLIRGAAPGDSGVFLDGTEIPLLYHFLGGPSVLHPEFLDRIDYYPGNPDVRYGRLLAGVVDVATRSTFSQQWGGSLDVNLLNASLFIKAPVAKRVTLSGAVRRSYIDAILPTLLKATERKATTVVPVYYDYQLRGDVDLAGDDYVFALFFGSDDQLAIATNEPEQDVSLSLNTHIAFHRFLAQWRARLTDRLVMRLTPTLGFNQIQFGLGTADIDLFTFNVLVRDDFEWKRDRRLTLRFGLDAEMEWDRFNTEVPIPLDFRNPGGGGAAGAGNRMPLSEEVYPVEVSLYQFGIGLYADAIWNVTRRLQLIPGARFELYRYVGTLHLAVDPRLTARFTLRQSTTLKAAAGLYSQEPAPNQLNDTFGNPRLTPRHAAHFSLGVEHRFLPFLSLDLQAYAIRRYNLVVATDAVREEEDGTRRPLRFTNQGNSYAYGLELLLRHDVTRHFYGWLAYTLSRTMEQREPGGDYVPFTFDQTHILTLVASFRLGVGWELGGRFRLVSGRPDTAVLEGIFDSDLDRYLRRLGPAGETRGALFHQLDLRVEKTWLFRLWRLSAYLDVQNVYNAVNPEATLYDYRFQESGPLRGLPFLPTLGLRGSF